MRVVLLSGISTAWAARTIIFVRLGLSASIIR
jgi:hypothetical protein